MEKSLGLLEGDFDQLDERFEELQVIVENTDNSARKHNIKLHRLKEWVEGVNLKAYLKDLFSACPGADSDILIQIVKSYPIGSLRKGS